MISRKLTKPRFVSTSRGRFAYISAGDPRAPLALCLHGFPDHAHTWMHLLPELADAGFHAVAPWLRGYDPSPLSGPLTLESLRDDILAITQTLAGSQETVLVGHDWGAVITCSALAHAPQTYRRAVTLAVPHALNFLQKAFAAPKQLRRSHYMLFFQFSGISNAIVQRRDLAYIDDLWRAWSPDLTMPPNFRAELKRCLRQSMPAPLGYYRAMTRPLGSALQRLFDPRRPERAISVPTLHLHGAADGCVGPECLEGQHRFFSSPLQQKVLADVGHFLHLENPTLVNRHIMKWLTTA
ncbi:MAG: alpha/beta hydrolase [Myxococcota bacterium]|nr:alpha/beta hydrolase [Myxococcota bacterium]